MQQFDPYDSLVPIFISVELPKRFMQIGTAVYIQFNNESFLITAAHVTDQSKEGTLLVPCDEGFSPIDGYMAFIDPPPDIPRGEDTVDIAYYRLSTQFAEKLSHRFTPLPKNRSELLLSAHELTVCSATGYPSSKSKKNGEIHSSEIFAFRGLAAQESTYKELGLSADGNIVIHFHKKRAVHPETGLAFPTPGLRGISGGGIFAWPRGAELSDDWSLPKLVGIVHSFREREGLIIGSTLLPVITAIGVGFMKNFGGVR